MRTFILQSFSMKKLLFLLPLLPVFAAAQNMDTTVIKDYCIFRDTIRQITIIDTFGQTIFNHSYNNDRVQVETPATPRYKYTVKINGTVVGQVVGSCSEKIKFDVLPQSPTPSL